MEEERIEEEEFLVSKLVKENVPKDKICGHPFFSKLLKVIQETDFVLPYLNRKFFFNIHAIKWKKMNLKGYKKLKEDYPKLRIEEFSSKHRQKLLISFDILVKKLSLENRKILLDAMNTNANLYLYVRFLVSCFLSGRKMLKKRIFTNVWIELMNSLKTEEMEFCPNVKIELVYSTETNDKDSVEKKYMFVDYLSEEKPPKENKSLENIFDTLKNHQFELPELNRITWTKWPMKMPPGDELEKIKQKYPNFVRGVLSDKEEEKMFDNFSKLLELLGYEPNETNQKIVMNKLFKSGRSHRNIRVRLLVACFVAGPKMLKNRLAINCWEKFVRAFEKRDKSVQKLDGQTICELMNKSEKRKFVETKSKLGFEPCQIRSKMLEWKFRQEMYKRTKTEKGFFSEDDEESLLYLVFKSINIKNIKEYNGQKIPWAQICKEFDRKPKALSIKWENMVPQLRYFEDTGNEEFRHHHFFVQLLDLILASGSVTKYTDVDLGKMAKIIKYLTKAQIFKKIHILYVRANQQEIPYQDMLLRHRDTLLRTKKGNTNQEKYVNLISFYQTLRDSKDF